jgi:uncharacterized membrane protein YhaH (DUF805 family)
MTLRAWFSCKGRICRKTWWVYYFLVPMAINVAAAVLDDYAAPEGPSPGIFGETLGGFSIVSAMALSLGLWAGVVGLAKRWHDLNRTGWWGLVSLIVPLVLLLRTAIDSLGMWWYVLIYGFLPVIFSVLLLLSPSADETSLQLFNDAPDMGMIFDKVFLPGVFMLLIFAWCLVILVGGVLPGTPGPNRFGPDPLAPPDAANIALPPSPQ